MRCMTGRGMMPDRGWRRTARRAMRPAALALCLLAGCTAPARFEPAARLDLVTGALPPMKRFGVPQVPEPVRANSAMAADFLDLTFQLESGRALPRLTRYEGPITVAVTGSPPASAAPDLARLLARLRAEAGIDISMHTGGGPASVTLEFLPRAKMQGLVPQAACFVVPRLSDWGAFRRARRSDAMDWATLETRTRAAIFIPNDTSPQDVRDCLHEELAQAIGPLNDLYRLPDSVFNDDNFHAVLTGFDMLILRATYAPELRAGMSRAEVAAVLPALLARLNPAGGSGAPAASGPTARVWVDAIETALGPGQGRAGRREAAGRAVRIAEAQGWQDARLAFSLFALGRLALPQENDLALDAFRRADAIYRTLPGAAVHAAHVDMQLAAFALSSGDFDGALVMVDRNLAAVAKAENASLLATLLMIRAEALAALGRPAEAATARLDSLGWARYGYGPDDQVRARMSGIAALSPGVRHPAQRGMDG